MEEQSVNTSGAPEVIIGEVGGSLTVKGWEETEVRARSESGGLNFHEEQDTVNVSCSGDLSLRVPSGSSVKIGTVGGDARVKLIEDPLSIELVRGGLTLRSVGPVQLGTVQGDLLAREVAGNLRIERVGGSLTARQIDGAFEVERTGGDLALREVDGPIQATAGGTARLRLDIVPDEGCKVSAGGDIHFRLPAEVNAAFRLSSGAQTLVLDLPDQRATLRQGEHSLTLGEGGAEISLSAGGVINLTAREDAPGPADFHFEFEGEFPGVSPDFAERLAGQIDAQVQAQMSRLSEQMSRLSEVVGKSGLSPEQAERVIRQAQETAEQAAARAQEKIARAQERIARKMEAAARKAEQREQRRADRRSQGWRFGSSFDWSPGSRPPAPPAPPRDKSQPVSDEERLLILRMLEQKKITLEEAEKLLAALEGKGD
jgi:hypothetical protein